jgi:hypothetical protein
MHFTLNKRVLRERLLAAISRPASAPLLVFGNQKSGTSAISGLLAEATGLRLITDFAGAQEPYIGELVRGETSIATYIKRNAWAFSADIVKEPGLTFVAPALMAHFPQSRAVTVIRDPWNNIRSLLERLDMRGDADRAISGSRRINRTWRSILAGADLGLPPAHYIDILATRWLRAAEIPGQLDTRNIVIRYEDFARDKRASIETLAKALGLSVVADISAKLDHAFQPRGRGAAPKEFFGKNYARIGAICGAKASQLGYDG